MNVKQEKSNLQINQSIYISDSEDDEEGKLIIDETKQIANIKLAKIASLRNMNNYLQKLYSDKKFSIRNHFKISNMNERKNPITVRLQSSLCKPPPPPPLPSSLSQQLPEIDIQQIITNHQLTNHQIQPQQNRPYTDFNIDTILGKKHQQSPSNMFTQNLPVAQQQFSIGTNNVGLSQPSNSTIYYSITPDYKCSICTSSRKCELIPRQQHYPSLTKPNQLQYSQNESAFKRPQAALNLSNSSVGRTKRLPSYCLMPTQSSFKSQIMHNNNINNKRIHPYIVQSSPNTSINYGNHILKSMPPPQSQLQPPPPPPPPPPAPISFTENSSILRSIIQPSCYIYPCTIVLTIPILASKFMPPAAAAAAAATLSSQQERTIGHHCKASSSSTLEHGNCMHPQHLIDLNSSCHFLLSYGDMRLNMIKFQNSYLRINLLKDFDNSIIDFRTLTKTEALVIRDTVRFSSKWSEFCSLIRSNLLDKESTLLYNHIFQKY